MDLLDDIKKQFKKLTGDNQLTGYNYYLKENFAFNPYKYDELDDYYLNLKEHMFHIFGGISLNEPLDVLDLTDYIGAGTLYETASILNQEYRNLEGILGSIDVFYLLKYLVDHNACLYEAVKFPYIDDLNAIVEYLVDDCDILEAHKDEFVNLIFTALVKNYDRFANEITDYHYPLLDDTTKSLFLVCVLTILEDYMNSEETVETEAMKLIKPYLEKRLMTLNSFLDVCLDESNNMDFVCDAIVDEINDEDSFRMENITTLVGLDDETFTSFVHLSETIDSLSYMDPDFINKYHISDISSDSYELLIANVINRITELLLTELSIASDEEIDEALEEVYADSIPVKSLLLYFDLMKDTVISSLDFPSLLLDRLEKVVTALHQALIEELEITPKEEFFEL